jgi:Domain of unknown function (DUF4352)
MRFLGFHSRTALGICVVMLSATACRDDAKTMAIGTFEMGERAQVGQIIYTVFDSQWAISLGDQAAPRVPSSRFLILSLSAINSSSKGVNIPTFTLIDDSGQTYQELDNGEGVHNWLGFVRHFQPAESAQGSILFDVPQKRFKLRVSDEEDQYAFINIPLTLGENSPDVLPKVP